MTTGALFERQGLGELDHLARCEIEIVGTHARIDFDLDLHKLARSSSVQRTPVYDAETAELRLVTEIDIFANRQVGQERLLLKYHPDALAVGVGRVRKTSRPRGDEDLAGIWLVHTA